jgi:transcriptional regulator with XRE-family HTH domain
MVRNISELTAVRKVLRINQTELSQAGGLDRTRLSRAERGTQPLEADELNVLTAALNAIWRRRVERAAQALVMD